MVYSIEHSSVMLPAADVAVKRSVLWTDQSLLIVLIHQSGLPPSQKQRRETVQYHKKRGQLAGFLGPIACASLSQCPVRIIIPLSCYTMQ